MTMTAPRVSVLLPVRNGEAFLADALDSVLSQTGPTFEVLVIDDGSTDATPAILAAYTDPRLRVIRQEGLGLVAALNAALDAARGEYCARMDADDLALPGRFAAQVAALDANPGAVMAHGAARVIDAAGREIGSIATKPQSAAEYQAALLHERSAPPIVHPTAMIRRAVLLAMGGYRQSPSCEDHDLWLRLLGKGAFLALPEPLLLYRQHDAGISRERASEQELSSLVNCVVARWQAKTGIDLYAKAPDELAALRAAGAELAGAYLHGVTAGRSLRMALRHRKPGPALGALGRLLATGRPQLASKFFARHSHLRLQHRLLRWLAARFEMEKH